MEDEIVKQKLKKIIPNKINSNKKNDDQIWKKNKKGWNWKTNIIL
jgi:hypothetical protein